MIAEPGNATGGGVIAELHRSIRSTAACQYKLRSSFSRTTIERRRPAHEELLKIGVRGSLPRLHDDLSAAYSDFLRRIRPFRIRFREPIDIRMASKLSVRRAAGLRSKAWAERA
jgi:hypothetical protein